MSHDRCCNPADLELVFSNCQKCEKCPANNQSNDWLSEVLGVRQSIAGNCRCVDWQAWGSHEAFQWSRTEQIPWHWAEAVQTRVSNTAASVLVTCKAVFCPSWLLCCNIGRLWNRKSGQVNYCTDWTTQSHWVRVGRETELWGWTLNFNFFSMK